MVLILLCVQEVVTHFIKELTIQNGSLLLGQTVDGNSKIGAHVRSNLCFPNCLWHLISHKSDFFFSVCVCLLVSLRAYLSLCIAALWAVCSCYM